MSHRFGIRREWTAAEADQWTKEDLIAASLGVLCFVGVAFGVPYAFLLHPGGFLLLALAAALGLLMLWVIGPKLEAVSADYETRQKQYLAHLEKTMRWEHLDE